MDSQHIKEGVTQQFSDEKLSFLINHVVCVNLTLTLTAFGLKDPVFLK
jgi:hypothetical protein